MSNACTIEHFRASRRRVEDLSTDRDVGGGCSDLPGYVYANGFFIEIEPDGSLYLPLVQEEHRGSADDLGKLEELLHAYASTHEFHCLAEQCHDACKEIGAACPASCPTCGGAS